MKLEWKSFKEGDTFCSAECGPISLDVDLVGKEEGDIDGWGFWIDETGEEGPETYNTKEEAQEAAERYAEDRAREILGALGL
jgi:hypothetical protein